MPGPAGTATAAAAPVFAAPRDGTAALASATRNAITTAGGELRAATVDGLRAEGDGWKVDGERFDAVVLATGARAAASLLATDAPVAADLLNTAETADVVMVTLHVSGERWPERLHGMSGYLVPKSVQRLVTAVSFGSQKWAHWAPADGGQILRVSLGRDGLPVLHLTDDEILAATSAELETHLGIEITPEETRLTRWAGAFPQYRPHHRTWVARVTDALPPGVELAGAAYRGIGVPACVRDGRRAAAQLLGGRAS
jgi:oxygen-dependent protoporphyrinogen oxidase